MKFKIILVCLALLLLFVTGQAYSQNSGYRIEVRNLSAIKDNPTLSLGAFVNGQVYAVDSAKVSNDIVVFQSNTKLEQGQYFLMVKPYFWLDLLIGDDNQNITIDIKPGQVFESKITGSRDTQLLWQYLRYQYAYKDERKQLEEKKSKTDESNHQKVDDEINALDKKVADYARQEAEKYKELWFGKYMKANIPVAGLFEKPKTTQEYFKNREYLKDHFFDNIDLQDPRFWRTEVLVSAIGNYMSQLVGNNVDSLANAASRLVAKSKGNDKAFKNMLSFFVNESINSNIVGDENVWAKLYEDYIQDKDVPWISSAQREMLKGKYERIRYNRLEMNASNLTLQTIDGGSINTNNVQASSMLLYFYDPDCESCKIDVPKLYNEVYKKYADKGFRVIAINVGLNQDDWRNFVKDNELLDWINCSDPDYKSQYMKYYDIPSTPTMFLLNDEKKILMKTMGEKDLVKILENYYSQKDGVN